MMKIAIIHNEYGAFSGEEAVVRNQKDLLLAQGHEVSCLFRSSSEIDRMTLGKARAFFSGMSNPWMKRVFRRFLAKNAPDVVHVHNLFPLISPSILPVCRECGVPVVMSVHNYRMVCPTGLHMPKGRPQACTRCSGGREYWCILKNCEQNLCKSVGYTLRTYVARRTRAFRDSVSMFVCLTQFQRGRLVAEGYPENRVTVVPNMVSVGEEAGETARGDYVGFVGRISPEKGIDTLREVARRLPQVPFALAGSGAMLPAAAATAGPNLRFCGHIPHTAIDRFFRDSRIIVLPSLCFEAFPLILVEAMLHRKPVIVSRIGGLPEIVDEGVTGLLFEPGNASALAHQIQYLWDRPALCRQMGQAGREKALREYSPQKHYERLMAVYEKARESSLAYPAGKSPWSPPRLSWSGDRA